MKKYIEAPIPHKQLMGFKKNKSDFSASIPIFLA